MKHHAAAGAQSQSVKVHKDKTANVS